MKSILIFTLLFTLNLKAFDAFELMTNKIYTSTYASVPKADEKVAKVLFPLTLQEAVNLGYITKKMGGLALPLGIMETDEAIVDFKRGMRDMWNYKKGILKKLDLQWLRERFINLIEKGTTKTTLREYRSNEITYSVDLLKRVYAIKKREYEDEDKKEFMRIIINNISQNVLIGYNIQELIPPAYKNIQMNPVFKTYYLNRLFIEAGKEFVEGFPARYDTLVSFGPFQMTNIAMREIVKFNKYLNPVDRFPPSVADFKTLQQHSDASAIFAYYNWEIMAEVLQKEGQLKKFNREFPKINRKKRQIFIAGVTACMHHLPSATRKLVAEYISKIDNFNRLHYMIRRRGFETKFQLQKYYDSAAEAYLIMKVFDILDDKYSKKERNSY